jgi:hypothetical protein
MPGGPFRARTRHQRVIEARTANSPEFGLVFSGDGISLLARQFSSRFTGWTTGFTKKPIQPRGCHDPQEDQFLIWVGKAVPRVLGYENRATPFARVRHIVRYKGATTFQHIEGFLHVEMPVNRNARADGQLLRAHREITGAPYGIGFDEDVPPCDGRLLVLMFRRVLIATKPPPLNLISKLNQRVFLCGAQLLRYRRLNDHGS